MGDATPTFEDWLLLLERFGLDRLKLSDDPADHASLAALRRAIAPFGLTLTERGLRQGRSVVDLVLSFSEAKCRAAADILELEDAALGDRLRALIITDFERLASGAERADGALERDAGSAFRAFRTIALDQRTASLNPVLVTGTTVRTTEAFAPELCELLTAAAHADGLDIELRIRQVDGIAEVDAEHASWRPGIYVALVSAIFEAGRTRVLVGTRALLGEGWDSPSANTLIDLTSVTTATGVQQLRGRILRLDPAWPTKTAHAYDVVCLDQSLERGGIEFERLVRRHDRTWGIVPPGEDHAGDVVRGLGHLDPALIRELLRRAVEEEGLTLATAGLRRLREPWQRLDLETANRRTAAAVSERDRVRALWRIGEPYDNAIDWFSRISLVADRLPYGRDRAGYAQGAGHPAGCRRVDGARFRIAVGTIDGFGGGCGPRQRGRSAPRGCVQRELDRAPGSCPPPRPTARCDRRRRGPGRARGAAPDEPRQRQVDE